MHRKAPLEKAKYDLNINAAFGRAIAVNDDLLIVGAYGYDKDSTASYPDTNYGALHLYKLTDSSATFVETIIGDAARDGLGTEVQIYGRIFISTYTDRTN